MYMYSLWVFFSQIICTQALTSETRGLIMIGNESDINQIELGLVQ